MFDFYETDNEIIMVFEKLEGGDLLANIQVCTVSWLQQRATPSAIAGTLTSFSYSCFPDPQGRERFTEIQASHVTRDIATGLDFLHEKGGPLR